MPHHTHTRQDHPFPGRKTLCLSLTAKLTIVMVFKVNRFFFHFLYLLDLAAVVADKANGGTTVAATMWIANKV